MGREHISRWRRTLRRHDVFRRRRKDQWSRSRKSADYIIATNDGQPDGSTVDSIVTSGYMFARRDRTWTPCVAQGESRSSRRRLWETSALSRDGFGGRTGRIGTPTSSPRSVSAVGGNIHARNKNGL